MDFTQFQSTFCEALAKNALPIPTESTILQFHRFAEHLLTVNQTTNLTAIRDPIDFIYKNLVDSLTVAPLIPQNATLLDLGCGPGFPALPLAIARPDLKITALDSTAKKIAFVQNSADLLGLHNIKAVSGRAEDAALSKKLGQFDIVTGRAVARLNILCELCLPYVKLCGTFIAMKGAKGEEELTEARQAIRTLGGAEAKLHSLQLVLSDGSAEQRSIIAIQKQKQSPAAYPRAYAAILKKPL